MALPCLSALSVRVPVPVSVTAEERSKIHNLSNFLLGYENESRDVKIGRVNALLALIEEGGNGAKNEIMSLWQRITMTSIVPELLDLLCDGSKEVLQLFASFRDMTYEDTSLDTIDAMIQKARTNSLVVWPGRQARDPIPSLMKFLFGPDNDEAEMAAGILDGIYQEDESRPSAVLLQMLELGLVEKTVEALLKGTTDERRREPLRFVADCCLEDRSTATIVHNSMVQVDGYKVLFQYLTSDLEDFQPFTQAFVALRQLLDVNIPQTPDEATLFIEPLVADEVWTSNTIANVQRDKILEYLVLVASKSPKCALGIAYHTPFLKRALDYSDDAHDLLEKLKVLEVPWLQLYIGLERQILCRDLQEIVPTEQALLVAIRANGCLYSAIERYRDFRRKRLKKFENESKGKLEEVQKDNVHRLAAYGTPLFCSVFNAKPDEMHEAAAKAERHPDPGSIKFVLNKYIEDWVKLNKYMDDDVSLRQKIEDNTRRNIKIDVEELLTPDQKTKLERYDEYTAFIDRIFHHQDFPSFRAKYAELGGDNETNQSLEDDLGELLKELERTRHPDNENAWTLRHILSVYGAADDMQREMEKVVTRRQEDEERRASLSGAPKRARTSAAALRAALAARVGATARV